MKETLVSKRKTRFVMKKGILIILVMALAVTSISAQKVFSVGSKYDADVKVFVVDSKYDADLVVFKVDSKYDVDKNGRWFFVDSKYDADKKIFFVDSKYDADLKIYYASSKYDAQWRESSKKHLME